MKQFIFIFLIFSSSYSQTHENYEEIALKSLQMLGANVDGARQSCNQCHTIDKDQILEWSKRTMIVLNCFEWFKDEPEKLKEHCLKKDDKYLAKDYGIWSAFIDKEKFIDAFKLMFKDGWESEYKQAVSSIQMPPHGNLFKKEDFAIMQKWSKKKFIHLEQILNSDRAYPKTCTPYSSKRLNTILKKSMAYNWKSYHQDLPTTFYGCSSTNTFQCFSEVGTDGQDKFKEVKKYDFSKSWKYKHHPHAKMRIIKDLPKSLFYWSRTSPDGRFFITGALGYIYKDNEIVFTEEIDKYASLGVDLETDKITFIKSPYDPNFTPDGTSINMAGGKFCPLSLLKYNDTNYLSFEEPQCSSIEEIELYQSLAISLENSDTFAVAGTHSSDYGGTDLRKPEKEIQDPLASWLNRSFLHLTHLDFDGRSYVLRRHEKIESPFFADWIISHTGSLLVSRKSGWDASSNKYLDLGLVVHELKENLKTNKFELQELAQFCTKGGKANFSYDDRFMVYHHYIDENDFKEYGFKSKEDEEFKKLLKTKKSDIWYIDLLEGTPRRITNMGANQFALFPHFRADGWLHFVVKDQSTNKNYLLATNELLIK